jgi:hydrogenase nickel incorporation protein HypA/HybF
MHELSLCKAIADTAVDHAEGRPVERIRLRIGHFRQVVPETLQSCWRMRVPDGPLAGCSLDVDYVPAVIRCDSCGANTELDQPIMRCEACDGTDVTMISGDEFLIESIDISGAPQPSTPEEVS